MPMSWTAENDRILFLKLIDTHEIKVNYAKIVEGWPGKPEDKPTIKALSERYSKLRKMANIVAPFRAGRAANATTPSKAGKSKAVATPSTSARKRKAKKPESDSDDGEDHWSASDDNTPKARKTAAARTPRSGKTAGKGDVAHDDGDDERDDPSSTKQKGTKVHVKSEPDDNPFTNGDYANVMARATQFNQEINPNSNSTTYRMGYDNGHTFNGNGSNMYGNRGGQEAPQGPSSQLFGNFQSAIQHGQSAYDSYMDNLQNTWMDGGSDATTQNTGMRNSNLLANTDQIGYRGSAMRHTNTMDRDHINMPGKIVKGTSQLHISPQPHLQSSVTGPFSARQSIAPSEASTIVTPKPAPKLQAAPRSRSARKASVKATEDVTAFLASEKQQNREEGERSSVEDSAESEYQGSDDD